MKFEFSERIRAILGNEKFEAMTGARDFVTTGKDLQFRLPKRAKNKINLIKIVETKDAFDTKLYDMVFYNFSPKSFKLDKVATESNILASSLLFKFTEITGLEVKL
jgi:hypothetical protein